MEERPQYHHYIPRFVLRNFVEAEESKANDAGKHNFPKRDRDGIIPYYDLDNGQLGSRRLSNAYGVTDMYRDISLADTNHIEKLLSKLESRAARIIQRIQRAHKERQPTVELSRRDLHALRKFLYVMEHRSKTVRRRFTGTMEEYKHNDRAQISEYIKKRGFKKPTEVWLESLRLVLEAEESADSVGYDLLKDKMYRDDYGMFRHALENFHICICEPEDPDMEFIISDNGFSVFEGNIILNNPANNDPLDHKAYIEYHKIATISPRLAIVLRSNIFREGNEYKKHAIYQIHSPSPLEDMPVHGAVPRYVNLQMPDGSIRPASSLDDIEFSMLDSYTFKIYKIPKKHVFVFNRTQIEEAKHSLTFCSRRSMAESLKNHTEHNPAPIALWSNPKFSEYIRIWSAKARLLTILDAKSRNGARRLSIFDPASAKSHENLETTKKKLQKSNYLKLTNGSLDMYSFDMFQAFQIDEMRAKIINITKTMEQSDATAVFRNFTEFLCEFIDTKTLLFYLRLKREFGPRSNTKKDGSTGTWIMLPSRAEECVFKLWGNPRVSTKEFNTLLHEALSKEDFRKTAAAGLRAKYGHNKTQHLDSLIGAEQYVVRQYGSIKDWVIRTGHRDTFEICRRYADSMSSRMASKAGFDLPDSFTEFEDTDEVTYREWVDFLVYSPNVFSFPETVTQKYAYLQDPVWKELITVHLYPLIDEDWIYNLGRISEPDGNAGGTGSQTNLKTVEVRGGRGGGGLRNVVLTETQNVMTVPAVNDDGGTPSTKANPNKKKKKKNKKKGKK